MADGVHIITTLQDGYEANYYPQTYAHAVKRQFLDESVETTLSRLEYYRKFITDQPPGTKFKLISYNPDTSELTISGVEVSLTTSGAIALSNGDFSADSSGYIIGTQLKLTGLTNRMGDLLTIDDDGIVHRRNTRDLLIDLGAAPLDSPAFTGYPMAPTPPTNTSHGGLIANVEFVREAIADTNRDWGWIKLAVDGWSDALDAQNYYTQRVNMTGMKAEYKPIFNLIVSNSTLEPDEKVGFFNLAGITMYNGYVIARTQVKPTVDLFLNVKGV